MGHDYLVEEFQERLAMGPIKYKLQIQLHTVSPDDSHLVLHSSRAWDPRTHPWMDLAEVCITTPVSTFTTEQTASSLCNHSPSICLLPEAKTIYDFTSVEYLRLQVYPYSRNMRNVKVKTRAPKNKIKYCIRVESGARKGAGTNATVTVVITGNN